MLHVIPDFVPTCKIFTQIIPHCRASAGVRQYRSVLLIPSSVFSRIPLSVHGAIHGAIHGENTSIAGAKRDLAASPQEHPQHHRIPGPSRRPRLLRTQPTSAVRTIFTAIPALYGDCPVTERRHAFCLVFQLRRRSSCRSARCCLTRETRECRLAFNGRIKYRRWSSLRLVLPARYIPVF